MKTQIFLLTGTFIYSRNDDQLTFPKSVSGRTKQDIELHVLNHWKNSLHSVLLQDLHWSGHCCYTEVVNVSFINTVGCMYVTFTGSLLYSLESRARMAKKEVINSSVIGIPLSLTWHFWITSPRSYFRLINTFKKKVHRSIKYISSKHHPSTNPTSPPPQKKNHNLSFSKFIQLAQNVTIILHYYYPIPYKTFFHVFNVTRFCQI